MYFVPTFVLSRSRSARIDPSTGATQFNSPLLLRNVPMHRVRDGAVWFVLLKAALMPEKNHTVGLLYQTIFPFLNSRPVLANLPSSAANIDGASAGAEAAPSFANSAAMAPAAPTIQTRWWSPSAQGDPYGYDLASLAATAALQLGATGAMGMGGGAPPGMVPGGMPAAGGPAWASAPVYSADGLELLLKHQLIALATKDLTAVGNASNLSVSPSTLELLSRASRRLSAHSP